MRRNTLSIEDRLRLERFININKSRKVVQTYLLPFTGLDALDFGGPSNIKQVLVDKLGQTIFVSLKKALLNDNPIKASSMFKDSFYIQKEYFYSFFVDSELELEKVLDGRYTELLKETKLKICERSALPTIKNSTPFKDYDVALQALFIDSPLRHNLATFFLLDDVADMPVELVSKLEETSPIYIENFIEEVGA